VNGFRDYQSVIQTRARRGDRTCRGPLDPEQVYALFRQMVRQAWAPAEIDILQLGAAVGNRRRGDHPGPHGGSARPARPGVAAGP
jgi:hypothetical protein